MTASSSWTSYDFVSGTRQPASGLDENVARAVDVADRVAHFRAFRVVRCRKRGVDRDPGESFFTWVGWLNFRHNNSCRIDRAIAARRCVLAFFALKSAVFCNVVLAMRRLPCAWCARSAFVQARVPRCVGAPTPEKVVSELLTPAKTVITFRPADGSCEHE